MANNALGLILGGVKSGKSRRAEQLAAAGAGPVVVIATARRTDDEMRARIDRHRRDRPSAWHTLEEPLALASALRTIDDTVATPGTTVVVDCLTVWLTNLLVETDEERLLAEQGALLSCLPRLPFRVLLVGNESGLGIMPTAALARRYADIAGVLHQQLAAKACHVDFCVAGLPMTLKHTDDDPWTP